MNGRDTHPEGPRRVHGSGWMVSAAAVLVAAALAAATGHDEPPTVVDTSQVKFEIVGVQFVTEYEGVSNSFHESEADKYRGLVLTVKITKPADFPLTIAAQDLPLHYYFGSSSDVAVCHGVSTFSTTLDADRPMKLLAGGYGKTTTKAATQAAETVYLDLFYENMEPDTSDLYLLVARDVGAHVVSKGWKP